MLNARSRRHLQPAAHHVDFTATALVKSNRSSRTLTGFRPVMINTNRRVAVPPAGKSPYFCLIVGSARDLLYPPTIGGFADS
jgi:hypothetical protein